MVYTPIYGNFSDGFHLLYTNINSDVHSWNRCFLRESQSFNAYVIKSPVLMVEVESY